MKPPGCLTLQGLCQRLPPVELDEPLHCRLRVLQSGREAVHRFRARLMRGVARRDDALHGWEGILLEELLRTSRSQSLAVFPFGGSDTYSLLRFGIVLWTQGVGGGKEQRWTVSVTKFLNGNGAFSPDSLGRLFRTPSMRA